MRLLNFSIGRVQSIQIGTEVIPTAHLKAPIPEPWRITENGAAGDQRAVHPDKLYAFARSAYDYWGKVLGIDPGRWPDGFFGENLTLDALCDDEVHIGDVFTVGPEVRVVVAGARTPCVKLAWRLGQPRAFQKTFAQSRRSGMYLGVLAPGVVHPGDVFERVEHDPSMPTVADASDFIGGHGAPPLEPLLKLLGCRHLSPANRMLLTAKREIAERAATASDDRWRGWRRFDVSAIVDEAPAIKSFHLRPTDGAPLCAMKPGQFVSVRLAGDGGTPITRCWSLSDYSPHPEFYRITVRRQSGEGSRRLHGLEVGDSLELRAPAGRFVLDMGSFRPAILIAAGIGITPLFAMVQAQLGRAQAPPVHLIYGGRTPGEIAFRDELSKLAAAHPNLHVHHVYSRSDQGERPAQRLSLALIRELLSDLYVMLGAKKVELPWFEGDIYLCGPGDFGERMSSAFIAGGANPDHVFVERFTAPAVEPTALEQARVIFSKSGIEAVWQAGEDLSLLELAERAGARAPNDCRAGACLTCRTRVIEGATTTDIGDGTALLCVGRPRTPALRLDL